MPEAEFDWIVPRRDKARLRGYLTFHRNGQDILYTQTWPCNQLSPGHVTGFKAEFILLVDVG